jgi:CelD/BcsL family acetyltransferase involved in cellulose biosynthesis
MTPRIQSGASSRLAGTYYWYLGGYDPQTAALGVGKIAIGEGIRTSIDAGRGRYDFMIGAEPYKYWYGARDDRGVHAATIRSRHPRSLAAFLLRRARAHRRS